MFYLSSLIATIALCLSPESHEGEIIWKKWTILYQDIVIVKWVGPSSCLGVKKKNKKKKKKKKKTDTRHYTEQLSAQNGIEPSTL